MTKPFKIRHPETRVEYELADVAFFVREYQPQGFVIVDPAPTGYRVPDAEELGSPAVEEIEVNEPKNPESADLTKMTRAELDLYAMEIGIEYPVQLATKQDVIDAIEAKRAE